MMKAFFILLWAAVAFGCFEEKDDTRSTEWKLTRMELTEICESIEDKVPDVKRQEVFLYTDGWMSSYSNTQETTSYDETFRISRESSFQYNENHSTATLTDHQSDSKRIYTLNDRGYATECIYTSAEQKRQYTFTYTDGYLTQLTESITPNDGIGEYAISHKLTLNYENGDLTSVLSSSLNNDSFTDNIEHQIDYEAGKNRNDYHLPCLQLLDTHPLSFHQEALYAGMLGKPTQHLTIRTSPHNIVEGDFENTKYTYTFDSAGKPIRIQSQTSYTKGNIYQYGFPNKRSISINIE